VPFFAFSKVNIFGQDRNSTRRFTKKVTVNRYRLCGTVIWIGLMAGALELTSFITGRLYADPLADRVAQITIENSEHYDSVSLLMAAGKASRLEDAAFLYYAGLIRAGVDMQVYEPVGTGGNSPATLLGAMKATLGPVINPAVMRDRDTLARIVARLANWTPKFEAGYDPGWEYKSALAEPERTTAAKRARDLVVTHLEPLSQLMQDDAYYAAFKTVQDYNLGDPSPKVSEIEFRAALERLEEIEKTRGIQTGLFSAESKAAMEESERFKKEWAENSRDFRDTREAHHTRENKYHVFPTKVCYDSRELTGADPSTFQVLAEFEYAKDASHVYVLGHEIPGADAKTFRILDRFYARDASTVYCGNVAMRVDDIEHFEVVRPIETWVGRPNQEWIEFLQETNFLFETGMTFASVHLSPDNHAVIAVSAWARDGKSYYCGPARVEGCDFASFEVLDEKRARDKNQEYTGAFATTAWANRRRTILKISFPDQ
jgi:hypothetical protein